MSEKNSGPESQGFTTRAIHAGSEWNRTSSLTPPIFQSSTFTLKDLEEGVATVSYTHLTLPTKA